MSAFSLGGIILGVLYLIGYVVVTFVNEGFLAGVLWIFLCCIAGYIGYYVGIIALVLLGIILFILRMTLWNIYTLLGTLALLVYLLAC